jgi:ribosomal protein RSM22 (predicted rRNA methylase)
VLTAPLPAELEQAIGERAGSGSVSDRARTSAELTRRYRDASEAGRAARSRDEALAYATARLPATYAAVRIALGELRERDPSFAPGGLLDVGAGPGAGLWAAVELWPSLSRLVAIEAEPEMARLGRELAGAASEPVLASTEWREGMVPRAVPVGPFDLVTVSYVLGELDDGSRVATLDRVWHAASHAVVIVEPGTPTGYERVIAARDALIDAGATVVAPCPHDRGCPLLGSNDWCHFGVRVSRTGAHRRAKGAQRGHEDEKFAYVVLARAPSPAHVSKARARILRHPQLRSGHVMLELCTADGVRRETISKRDRDRYRRARKSAWGEDLGQSPTRAGRPNET